MTPSSWTPFDSFREMKVVSDGKILVIRPSDTSTIVPLFCSLCLFPMKTSYDSNAFRKAQCCDKCLLFCHGKKEKVPLERWEEYILDRQNAPMPLFILK